MSAVLKQPLPEPTVSAELLHQVHRRLIWWGREKFYPGWEEPTPSAVIARMIAEGRDKRRRLKWRRIIDRQQRLRTVPCKETRGVKMELFVHKGATMMCAPDGGCMTLLLRKMHSIERSTLCRIVGELLVELQDHNQDLWHAVRVTYRDAMNPAEIPRSGKGAAEQLSIAPSTYWLRRKEALTWLAFRLPLDPDLSERA